MIALPDCSDETGPVVWSRRNIAVFSLVDVKARQDSVEVLLNEYDRVDFGESFGRASVFNHNACQILYIRQQMMLLQIFPRIHVFT